MWGEGTIQHQLMGKGNARGYLTYDAIIIMSARMVEAPPKKSPWD